jgi:hypothetical protein
MRCLTALCVLLFMRGAASADVGASRFKISNGKIIVAQTDCGICAEGNTSCRLECNGAGACLQACDEHYRDCLRQNFCGRR